MKTLHLVIIAIIALLATTAVTQSIAQTCPERQRHVVRPQQSGRPIGFRALEGQPVYVNSGLPPQVIHEQRENLRLQWFEEHQAQFAAVEPGHIWTVTAQSSFAKNVKQDTDPWVASGVALDACEDETHVMAVDGAGDACQITDWH